MATARTSLPCAVFLALLALAAVLAAGCANGNRNRDAGSVLVERDGELPPPTGVCGPTGERCCAGSTCELGLRCSRDVCCIVAGSATRCTSANDCCTGLTCNSGVCSTPRGGTCTGSADCASGLVCSMGVCRSPETDLPPDTTPCGGGAPCAGGETCVGGSCETCGGASGACCAGFTCRSGLVCNGGTCAACGGEGQSCCDGATPCTSTMLGCTRGTGTTSMCTRIPSPEEACGTIDRPACGMDGTPVAPGSGCAMAVCEGDLRCVEGMCLNPDDEGGEDQPCGPRGGCDGMLICTYGGDVPICRPTPDGCGRDMQMCCDTGSTSGGSCEGALHCQTGGCTTCAGPSITCVLGGLLPGQQCCNGAVCRPAPLIPRCCVGEGETCVNSADCCGFMMCQDGMCQAGRSGSFCIDSSECADGLECRLFTCQAAEECIEPNTACTGGTCCTGLACAPDVDAEAPVFPPENRCCSGGGASCDDSFDCCGQMFCNGGLCECIGEDGPCWSDVDCCDEPNEMSCVVGTCQSTEGCGLENTRCPAGPDDCCGLDCRPDTWADTAATDRYECCSNNRCFDSEDCCGEMLCVEGSCASRAIGETCAYDLDCQGGTVCTDGHCAVP